MFPVNVLIGGVTAPAATTEREGLAHAIPQIATVGGRLRLVHHDARGFGATREGDDVLVAIGVDAAGVTHALVFLNGVRERNRLVNIERLYKTPSRPRVFPQKGVVRHAFIRHDNKFPVFWNGES